MWKAKDLRALLSLVPSYAGELVESGASAGTIGCLV